MGPLSNLFKRSDIFQQEFDRIFPARPFNKVNVLNYITVCTDIVLTRSRKRYPEKGLKFINPLFIVDNQIYPASGLSGDPNILRLLKPVFGIVQSKTMSSISLPILDNLLSGVCLCFGNTYNYYEYNLFKSFDLDSLTNNVGFIADELSEQRLSDKFKYLKIDASRFTEDFNYFAEILSANTEEEKMKLIKALILYKDISNALSQSLVYSFVNKYNQTRSFFDCLMVLISERPFDEDELLDFALITEGISLPIANYDVSKSKGISAQTMAKRGSLKTLLFSSFKQQ